MILKVQSNYLLITHHFHETHICHRILNDQPGHLPPDHQHPVDQPTRFLGQDNMITVFPDS